MKSFIFKAQLMAVAVLLSACGSDDDSQPEATLTHYTFEVDVTNMTAAQPLSPVAVMSHGPELELLTVGSTASTELEVLAEGGDNSQLLAMAAEHQTTLATMSGEGVLTPGTTESVTLEFERPDSDDELDMQVSVVSMLVNTNDAVTAINGQSIASLNVGESVTFTGLSYDAGTEANTEHADHIPGPAAAGGMQEGFSEVRDDFVNQVLMHSGVITAADGLETSVLQAEHRWDNPVMLVKVSRIE
ncbi:spondin domain-containing protein [Gilvimarinus agarilyticus]|uniref:spondin domain-containing protein n=1 Tax=Gilvimarinus sp. 2_MG-2023 TaxID=3062666 RepID=UPI001C084783|nr:spondin domain-containing protein [Gilvimarinus sp. 2_MG-2023]MBU2885461.1 spondin domain-containing protein [Gilvimarinus agarilyticus]MDO6570361.1 spondin domain-containing protein [Gilvimarinus sp. 2_MG-2023]